MKKASLGVLALVVFFLTAGIGYLWVTRTVPDRSLKVQTIATRERSRPDVASSSAMEPRGLAEHGASGQRETVFHPESTMDRDSIHGRVVDTTGAGIAAAAVEIVDSMGDVVAATPSNEDGSFSIHCPEGIIEGFVAARKSGFSEGETPLERTRPHRHVVLTLRESGELHGSVRLPDGRVPPAPVDVLAWRADYPMPRAQVARSKIADASLFRRRRVAPDGTFTLTDLTPNARYCVVAGGSGFATYYPDNDYRPLEAVSNGPSITLQVAPLYSVHVRVVANDGGALRCSPLLMVEGGSSISLPKTLVSAYLLNPGTWLSGIDVPKPGSYEPGRFRYLFTSAELAERLGPVRLRFSMPGYESKLVDLWAHRVTDEQDVVQCVTLQQIATGFGDLTVDIQSALSPEARNRLQQLRQLAGREGLWMGSLHLVPIEWYSKSVQELSVPISDFEVGPLILHGVPAGKYELQLRSQTLSGVVQRDTYSIAIDADRMTSISVDTGEWGVLEVNAVKESGESYHGTLSLSAMGPEPMPYTSVRYFSRAPYVFTAMPPGVYQIHTPSFGNGALSQPITVVKGEVVKCYVRLGG